MATVRITLDDARAQLFPAVCVRTGEDATAMMAVDVRHSAPKIRLELPVAARVAARRRDRIALALACTVGGVVLIIVGVIASSDLVVGLGVALALAAIVLTATAMNVSGATAQLTKDGDVVLDRVHERFAAEIERFSGPSRSRRRRNG